MVRISSWHLPGGVLQFDAYLTKVLSNRSPKTFQSFQVIKEQMI